MTNELKLINMQDVKCESVEWLLYPFITYGKITIIQGDPGEGKTTFVLQIIARLTKGESIIDDKDTLLTMLDIRLEKAIRETGARLVVLDPIQGFLGADVDMHRANEIRPVMKHIQECATFLCG